MFINWDTPGLQLIKCFYLRYQYFTECTQSKCPHYCVATRLPPCSQYKTIGKKKQIYQHLFKVPDPVLFIQSFNTDIDVIWQHMMAEI